MASLLWVAYRLGYRVGARRALELAKELNQLQQIQAWIRQMVDKIESGDYTIKVKTEVDE